MTNQQYEKEKTKPWITLAVLTLTAIILIVALIAKVGNALG